MSSYTITKFEHDYIKPEDFQKIDKSNYKKLYNSFEDACKKINESLSNREDEEKNVKICDIYHNKIKFRQYVGSISFKHDGTTVNVEILPKIFRNIQSKEERTIQARNILTKMLTVHIGVNPKILKEHDINFQTTTFMDIFIQLFAQEVDSIIKKGLKKKYKRVRENKKVLKGRLVMSKHLRKNLFHKDRFFVEYEQFSIDIPENIVLKTALSIVSKEAHSWETKQKVRNLMFVLDEVSISTNPKPLLDRIYLDRTTSYYKTALKFAKLFINKKSFSVMEESQAEEELNALVFDMNRLFESYVAYILGEEYNLPIQTQKTELSLAKEVLGNEEKEIFRLKPDIYLETNKIYILDTKWKELDENEKNYGISQSDMYQMLAYAVRFAERKSKKVEIALIYPKNHNFSTIKRFIIPTSCDQIPVSAEPFDIENDANPFPENSVVDKLKKALPQ